MLTINRPKSATIFHMFFEVPNCLAGPGRSLWYLLKVDASSKKAPCESDLSIFNSKPQWSTCEMLAAFYPTGWHGQVTKMTKKKVAKKRVKWCFLWHKSNQLELAPFTPCLSLMTHISFGTCFLFKFRSAGPGWSDLVASMGRIIWDLPDAMGRWSIFSWLALKLVNACNPYSGTLADPWPMKW